MTTKRLLFALAGLFASACTTDLGIRGGLSEDRVAQLPAEVRDAYDLFAYKCSRCHTLARPLGAQITDFEHWRNYVARMRHHAGSAISAEDGDKILVFLRYYTDQKLAERRGETATSTRTPTRQGELR